jgi:hypothetical protein
MADIDTILQKMRTSPATIPFADLVRVCTHHFGKPRHDSGSHKVFKMQWAGDPRINLQEEKGKGKAYQVRQALEAIDKLVAMQAKAAAPAVAAPPAGPVKKASKAKSSKGKKK